MTTDKFKIKIFIFFLFLISISTILFLYLKNNENNNLDKIFSYVSKSMHYQLQNQIKLDLDMLFSMQIYMNEKGLVSRKEFKNIAEKLIAKKPEILSFQYRAKIKGTQRDSFENYIRSEGFNNFKIKTKINGEVVVAGTQDVYYPINYLEPFEKNKIVFGVDFGTSQMSSYNAMLYADASFQPGVSNHFILVQEKSKIKSFLVYSKLVDKFNNSIGFISGIFRLELLINNTLEDFFKKYGLGINVYEYDLKKNKILIGQFGHKENILNYVKSEELVIGNHKWIIDYYTSPIFYSLYENNTSVIVLTLGYLLAFIFTYLYYKILTDNKKELQLKNNKLEALTENLKSKNDELSELNAIASHDLKSPATSIIGLVDYARSDFKNDNIKKDELFEILDSIYDSSTRMMNVIEDILEYSKLGKNRIIEAVLVDNLISNIKFDLSSLVTENKATINLVNNIEKIKVYPTEFRLLMQNLINNAIKFKKPDVNPIINIIIEESNLNYTFSISDNGIGIPEKNIKDIFKMFNRGNVNKRYSGSGIGLAHCKKIVNQHKGNIWVSSEVGFGTTFYFTVSKNIDIN